MCSMPLMKKFGRRLERAVVGEREIGDAIEHPVEQHAQFQPGEVGAEAEVRADPEREVVVGLAVGLERLRIVEVLLVEVGRLIHQQHLVAGVQLLAAELEVPGDRAVHVLDGRDPAQHLLDGQPDAAAIGHQPIPVLAVDQQLLDAAGDDVAGRLVAADEDEQGLADDVLVGEALARRSRH